MPPEGAPLSPRAQLLTRSELTRLVRVLAALGVRKLRLTGGEPTLRPDLPLIIGKVTGGAGSADGARSRCAIVCVQRSCRAWRASRRCR